MTTTIVGGTIWVCDDCMFLHANGDAPTDPRADQPEPWALWDESADVTMGGEHECDAPDDHDCDCERRSFSWSACEGCGSNLGGSRHAFTYWAAACNVMFCISEPHEGDDQHYDATGHTWTEATPDAEVIARVYVIATDSDAS